MTRGRSLLTRQIGLRLIIIIIVVVSTVLGIAPCTCGAEAVLIGYFGPSDPLHQDAGDLWCAASMAVEQANEAGGYKGVPFRLVPGWSDDPWGSGVRYVVRMAYVDRVWAIIGGMDGPTTHLAEQVVAKAQLVLLNPTATGKAINMASVPWMFSCMPPDDSHAKVLAEAIASSVREQTFVLVSGVDHDSHGFTVELRKLFQEHHLQPAFHFQCDFSQPASRGVLDRIQALRPQVVVLVADARQSASLIGPLREQGYEGAVFGGPQMGRRAFAEQAGTAAEGVVFPCALAPASPSREFTRQFVQRYGHHPDYAVMHMYDTVGLLVAAVRQAGLDRAGICDAVRAVTPWSGTTGPITFNTAGANMRPVSLATIGGGQIQPIVASPSPSDH